MMVLVKYLLNALLAIILGTGVPATTGLTGWELYVATGVVAAIIAVFNLWQHKPGSPQGK